MARRRWDIDPEGLDRARTRMGLKRPLTVKVTGLRRRAGLYKGIREGRHQITVSASLCASEAGQTIWHEIAHAKQREAHQTEREFWRAYRQSPVLMELSACAAERLNERFPLCLPK